MISELIKLQNKKNATTNEAQKQVLTERAEQNTVRFIHSIPDSLQQLKSAVRLTDTINKSIEKQLNVTSYSKNPDAANQIVEKDYDVSWFKENYFLQFDEMRVLLKYLDKRLGIQVQICQTKSSAPCPDPIKTKEWISYDKPLTVKVGNFNYRISLQAIDQAGNNPFKPTAYILYRNTQQPDFFKTQYADALCLFVLLYSKTGSACIKIVAAPKRRQSTLLLQPTTLIAAMKRGYGFH